MKNRRKAINSKYTRKMESSQTRVFLDALSNPPTQHLFFYLQKKEKEQKKKELKLEKLEEQNFNSLQFSRRNTHLHFVSIFSILIFFSFQWCKRFFDLHHSGEPYDALERRQGGMQCGSRGGVVCVVEGEGRAATGGPKVVGGTSSSSGKVVILF